MKRPEGASKGIFVLTRQEMPHVLDDLRPVRRVLEALRETYLVAVAETWSQPQVSSPPWVDFHLARSGAVSFVDSDRVTCLPFDAGSFIPAYFRQRGGESQWDVVSVTRAADAANVGALLHALRALKDHRPQTRALVLCRALGGLESPGTLARLLEQYHRDFTHEDRNDIALVVLHPHGAPLPMPGRDMAWVYGSCRLFVSFDSEGLSPAAAKEALLCGLPLVVHRDTDGGVLELTNPENSRLFSEREEAVAGMLELLATPGKANLDTLALARSCCETHTVPKLLDALAKLYEELDLPFRGQVDTEELCSKLSSAAGAAAVDTTSSGWGRTVRSPAEMLERLKQLVLEASGTQPLSPLGLLQAELDCRRRAGQERARTIFGQARRVLRRPTP